MNLTIHLHRQRRFSLRTFGPGPRAEGVCDHIMKEVREVLRDPNDISEWIDIAILAFDGALRQGYTPEDIVAALEAKQTKNENRKWPDWRTVPAGQAIEHVRDEENLDGTIYHARLATKHVREEEERACCGTLTGSDHRSTCEQYRGNDPAQSVVDVKQIVFALRRAEHQLQEQADRLHDAGNYDAE